MSNQVTTQENPPVGQDVSAEATQSVVPPVDLIEYPDRIEYRIDLPGVPSNAISLQHESGTMSISATRRIPGENSLHREFEPHVAYQRSFSIGRDYDADQIAANARDGVLTIVIPKLKAAQARRIEIA